MSDFDLPDEITYFLITGNDGFNKFTFAAGIKVNARVAKRERLITDGEGKQQHTAWAVYTEVEIPQKAYIFIGNAEGETELPEGARQVKSFSGNDSSTDIKRVLI